jgi:hypothetical protein
VEGGKPETVGEVVVIIPVLSVVDADLLRVDPGVVVRDGRKQRVRPFRAVLLGEDVAIR